MRTFVQQPSTARRALPATTKVRRTLAHQDLQRMPAVDAGPTPAALPPFGHDLTRIPLHPPPALPVQAKLAISQPDDEFEQAARSGRGSGDAYA